MTRQRVSAERILIDGLWQTDKTLVVENGVIVKIAAYDQQTDHLFNGSLIPGFIDVQVNGGGGVLFNAAPSVKSIKAMQQAHMAFGTTAMLPTLITDTTKQMLNAANAISQALSEDINGIIGIHFEGPFLSPARRGVHKSDYIRVPSDDELKIITRTDIGSALLTVSPENFPVDLIRDLTRQGVIVSLGHSDASIEKVLLAIEAGASGFTHLYNAMSPLTSRDPGMVGAAFSTKKTYAGIILDGFHVHPVSSKIAIQTKGSDRIMLVTDAMAHVGSEVANLPFFDTYIENTNNKLTTPDGRLAGSCLDMLKAVVYAHQELGLSLEEAIAMASTVPANFLKINNRKGCIQQGYDADFLLLNSDLAIEQVFINGERQR